MQLISQITHLKAISGGGIGFGDYRDEDVAAYGEFHFTMNAAELTGFVCGFAGAGLGFYLAQEPGMIILAVIGGIGGAYLSPTIKSYLVHPEELAE